MLTTDEIKLLPTLDGTYTLLHRQLEQTYHSTNGALDEALHVFVANGLIHYLKKPLKCIKILEVGFGSGMNFLVTANYCLQHHIKLNYIGIEPFPIDKNILRQAEYFDLIENPKLKTAFENWYGTGDVFVFEDEIILHILQEKILDCKLPDDVDIVYFDAFSPDKQAEMWTEEVIGHTVSPLKKEGIFVSYSITGNLKRIFRSLGFSIEKPSGASGKREMIRATKSKMS